MKKDKNFYHVLIMILFVVSFVSAFFLAEYSVHLGKLVATASVVLFSSFSQMNMNLFMFT